MSQNKKMKSDFGWAKLVEDFDKPIEQLSNVKGCREERENSPELESLFKRPNKKWNSDKNLYNLIELCEPKTSADLAVSKQKQNEITEWILSKGFIGKPRILLLSGPSGCGKTVAIKIIAKEIGFQTIEWIPPTDCYYTQDYIPTKQADKFLEFLFRVTRYSSVLQTNQQFRRILLVKDIPNVYFYDKESFYILLEKYLESGKEPLVFICPDSETSTFQYSLFPPEVIQQFNIDTINVKGTTEASMKSMMERAADILDKDASHILNITQDNIDEILANNVGDVRSALLNLIFISLKLPNDKSELKKECQIREQSLGLFHALRRVLQPKTVQQGDSWTFLRNPDDIAVNFESQANSFTNYLQQNYIYNDLKLEGIEICTDILSLCDIISTEYQDTKLSKLNLCLLVRGLMVGNTKMTSTKIPQIQKPMKIDTSKIQSTVEQAEEKYYTSIIRPKPCSIQNFNIED